MTDAKYVKVELLRSITKSCLLSSYGKYEYDITRVIFEVLQIFTFKEFASV